MSKFKGTPGPWSTVGTMTLYVETRIPGGLIQEVAAVGPTEADGGYGEKQRANARLIAAAPELLEALDDLIHLAESAMLRANYDGGEYDIDGELSDARAAIAKALGEDAT